MRPFSYERPATLDEALGLLGAQSRPLAGGTDLVTLMKADLVAPGRLVAVRHLVPAGIAEEAGRLVLGGGMTLSEVERDARIRERFPVLAQAAAAAASAQLRNVATLGGNLLQRPRCWYFRNPRAQCWLKGGTDCFAREGENRLHALFATGPCVAVHPSDLAAALLTLDAEVRLRARQGERHLPLDRFLQEPTSNRRTETALAEDELVVGVVLPAATPGARSVYLKAMDRQAFSFALVSVAVRLDRSSEGKIRDARVVLGGVAPVPRRAHGAERILAGASPTDAVLQKAAEAALAEAAPLRHNAWKIPLAKALVSRALKSLL